MNYKIIGSSSKGNCVKINNIMVDCGMTYKAIQPYLEDVKLIFLTHKHQDHYKPSTVKKINENYPGIRFVCPLWMKDIDLPKHHKIVLVYNRPTRLKEANINVMYHAVQHNVDNCCWKFKFIIDEENDDENIKVFYATDLNDFIDLNKDEEIKAKNYDYYFLEYNHTNESILRDIEKARQDDVFSYKVAAKNNHLSEEKAQSWLNANMGVNSNFVRLHESSVF